MRPFKAEHYYRASLERIQQAYLLYDRQHYALAMYVGGLAVECLFRAFKTRASSVLDEKHDLLRLLESSGILQLKLQELRKKGLSESQLLSHQRRIQVLANDVYLLWSNDYRFASEDRLRSHLKSRKLFRRGLKGDILKASAYKLVSVCQQLLAIGSMMWDLS